MNLRQQMRRHLAFGQGPNLSKLLTMLREGADVAECRLAFPELSAAAIRRAASDAGYYPGAVALAPAERNPRAWTGTEVEQLTQKVATRTADQIRYDVMPWRSAAEIRLKVRELKLAWGEPVPVVPAEPHERPVPRGRGQAKPSLVASFGDPVWTRDQDNLLVMQAGALPVVVLRERLAAHGPRWTRPQIRDRLRALAKRGRVLAGRSLVLSRLDIDAQKVVKAMRSRGATVEEMAVALGRGYTPTMVRKAMGSDFVTPGKPVKARGGRNTAQGLEALRQRLVFPLDHAGVLKAFQECGWQVNAWAKLRGFAPYQVQEVLRTPRACRGKALEIARALGLEAPAKALLPPDRLTFRYPTTPEQAQAAFRAHGLTMSAWAQAHGFRPSLVSTLLTGHYRGLRGKAQVAAEALGLRPARTGKALPVLELVFPYPTPREKVRKALVDSRVSVEAWAKAHGFATQTVFSVLSGHSPATKGAAREAAIKLGLVPASPVARKSAEEIHFTYPTTDLQVRETLRRHGVAMADWSRARGLDPDKVRRVLDGRGRSTVDYAAIATALGMLPVPKAAARPRSGAQAPREAACHP